MRGLDNNEEAKNLVENFKGSTENRMRSLYNLGYWQGFNDGQREAVQMLERTLMDMTAEQTEPNSSEKPNNYDEPQTDCTEALTLLWIKNMVTDEEFYRIDARLKCINCKWWNDTIAGGSECVSKECTYQPKDEPKVSEIPTGSADTQTYITEDRDTRILDVWQVKQMQDGKE